MSISNRRQQVQHFRAALPFVLTLILAACSGDDTTPPPTLGGESNTLTGTVQYWSGQTAVLEAMTENTQEGFLASLAKTTINPDGSFRLTMPGAEVMRRNLRSDKGLRSASCPREADNTVDVNPKTIKISYLFLFVHASDDADSPITGVIDYGTGKLAPRTEFEVIWIYAGLDATITGSCSFTRENEDGEQIRYTDKFDVELKTGWNNLIIYDSESADGLSESTLYSTGAIPEGGKWKYNSFE